MGMRKYIVIYEEAVRHIRLCNRSYLEFLIYEENLVFFFISGREKIKNKYCKVVKPTKLKQRSLKTSWSININN